MAHPQEQTYTVRGHWPFPLDMLRHDGSRPATDEDQQTVDRLSTEHAEDRSAFNDTDINLIGPHKPNTARWESFGWTVPADEDWALEKAWREAERKRAALVESALAKLTPEERDAMQRQLGFSQ